MDGDKKVDVLIIGGGMAGLLCAWMLEQDGVDYALVEAGRIAGGVTKDTTAKITVQHGLIYHRLLQRFGLEQTQMYWHANQHALEKYRSLCTAIPCGFERKSSVVYSRHGTQKLEREMEALSKIGARAEYVTKTMLPFAVAGAVKLREQAQFHPLQFLKGLVQGLNIYEETEVKELTGLTAVTDHGTITAQKIIVTTHFPFLNKHGSYFLKLYQHRSYVIALERAADVDGMYVDEAEKGLSFRNYKNLLLLGGGGHRTGKQGGNWDELTKIAKRYYPQARETGRWATQDCMSLDGVPYIGPYSRNTQGLFVATGFNKWGMTSSMAAAMLLCDLVQERENPYAPVFSPSRSMLRPQLALNGLEAMASLLTPSKPRCPHMGCVLKWNPQERSWDCPCHGSRFEENGTLLNNPATGDLTL